MDKVMIKSVIAGAIAFASAMTANAVDLYVNANIGSDDYDGSSPTVVSGTVGPKKTLMGALTLSSSGDTVYAAAGMYTNGVYETKDANTNVTGRWRARVKGGVKLIGEDPDTTFIVGEADPDVSQVSWPKGCGSNATACVKMEYDGAVKKAGIIRGFTITGGRWIKSISFSSGGGAGIHADNASCLAVDCVFTNNRTTGRGGASNGASFSKCVFGEGNESQNVPASSGAYIPGSFVNCVIGSANGIYNAGGSWTFLNCTIRSHFQQF